MAEIRKFFFARHLRSEPSMHVLKYRRGKLTADGQGLAFWFLPLSASIAEVPIDDRDLQFVFHGRSADYQDVTAQGVITYRLANPATLARHIDFSIDLRRGRFLKQPLEQLGLLLTQLAQQLAWAYMAKVPVRVILGEGHEAIRLRIAEGLAADQGLSEMGIMIGAVRVVSVKPTPDIERALETPMHERIQQDADEAAFERRALAVEKERAIQENELKNQIELARREEELIAQQGGNARRRAEEEAAAKRIEVEGRAVCDRIAAEAKCENTRLAGAAEGERIRLVGQAQAETEDLKMAVYREMSPQVLLGLAAKQLADKLKNIGHLNVTPDLIGPLLGDLIQAGTNRLDGAGGK